MPVITLDTSDAAELAELLQLLRDWIDTDEDRLNPSLTNYVDGNGYNPDYSLDHLRVDLDRFTLLLGDTSDGEPPF
jgi:hypothetical protein